MTLFNRIAGSYDRLNRLMTFGLDVGWRRRAVRLVPEDARQILDIACGTGDLVLALRKARPAATVTGLDIAEGMLAHARVKCPGVAFHEGDVLTADWGKPDAVTCAFGFRNFPDKAGVLAKAATVLPPGGTLMVLEFWRPGRVRGFFVSQWLRLCTALFVRGEKAEYRYLRRSIETTWSQAEFEAAAEKAGLRVACVVRFFPSATAHLLVRSRFS